MNPLDDEILIFPTYAEVFIPMSRHFWLWYPNCIVTIEVKLWSQVQDKVCTRLCRDLLVLPSGKGRTMVDSTACKFRRGWCPLLLAEVSRNFATGFTRRNRTQFHSPELCYVKLLLPSSNFIFLFSNEQVFIRQRNIQEDLIGASNLSFSRWENSAEFTGMSFLFEIIGYTCDSL